MIPLHIRVLRHSAFYSPLILTIAGGYLAEEGLEPHYDIATNPNTIEQGLNSSQVQVAQSAVATRFAGLASGESSSIRHFAQINQRDGFFITARKPRSAFQWHDLVDGPVLVDHFFQPLAMFRYALYKQDIDYKSLTVLDAGDVQAIDAAYRAGQGAYVHQQGPFAQQLEADGLGAVVASVGEIVGPVAFSSLCATQSWLSTDMAAAFYRAYCRGRKAAMGLEAAEIARLESTFFPDIDMAVLADTIKSYQQLGCWQGDPSISESVYEKTLDVFEFSGDIKSRFAYEDIVSLPPIV